MHAQSRVSEPDSQTPRPGVLVALGLIAIAAAAAALWARWGHSLSVDEPFTALAFSQPLSTLFETLRHDNTPVTYLALKVWTSEESELALRSLMAVSYAVAVFATGLAGVALGGARCGLLAALLVATSGSVGLLHAATVRPYALVSLFSALSALLLTRAIRQLPPVSRRLWVALTIVHLLGLFTHPTYIFLALGSAAVVWLTLGSLGRPLAMTGIIAVAIWIASWGWMLRATFSLPATAWMAAPQYVDLWNAYLGIWGNRNGFVLTGALLAVLTAPGNARRILGDERIRTIVLVAIVAFAGPFIISFVKPVFHLTRTPMLALPYIALAAASILTMLGSRMLILALSLLFLLGGAQYVVRSRRQGDPNPTRESVSHVLSQALCADTLISVGLAHAPVKYYLQKLAAPRCIAHETFPADVAAHPGWIDTDAIARNHAVYEAEAQAVASRLAQSYGRVFVFTKWREPGADAAKLLGLRMSANLRKLPSLPVRGAFFDEVLVFASVNEAPRR